MKWNFIPRWLNLPDSLSLPKAYARDDEFEPAYEPQDLFSPQRLRKLFAASASHGSRKCIQDEVELH